MFELLDYRNSSRNGLRYKVLFILHLITVVLFVSLFFGTLTIEI